MENRFGIDWDEIIRKEFVSRLAAAPFFEEAGSLLMSAGLVWQGRLGAGRLRGRELAALGHKLRDAGSGWRHSALGWSPPPEWTSCYSRLLAEFRDHRSFMIDRRNDSPPPKDPQAARALVAAAIVLIQDQLPVIGATGRHLYRREEVDKWEDLLETLGDHPAAEPPDRPLTRAETDLLGLRAAYRTCEGLCSSLGTIWIYADSRGSAADKDAATGPWYARAEAFRDLAKEAYLRFASGQPAAVKDALLAARDDASAYCFSDHHYADRAEITCSEKLAQAIISVLLQLAGERYGREAAATAAGILLTPELSAPEKGRKRLSPASK